jgi:tetratricopeptide (TPR) repeat protein
MSLLRSLGLVLSGPRHPDILSNLGAAYAGLGNYPKAIENYEQAIALREDHTPTRINLGLAYYKAAEPAKAIEQFTRVLAVDPENLQAASLLADCYFRLDQYREVIDVLTPFENRAADNPGIAYLLGTALIRENRPGEGQEYVDLILRRGDSPEAHLMLASAYRMAGDIESAVKETERAIELNPTQPGSHALLGQLLLAVGGVDQARRNAAMIGDVRLPEHRENAAIAFRAELELSPNDFDSNFYLGYLLKQEGNYDEALVYLKKAESLRPEATHVSYHLATVYQYQGDLEAAEQVLQALAKRAPEFIEAHVSLATIYYRLGRKDEGDREREIVIRLTAEKQARDTEALKKSRSEDKSP